MSSAPSLASTARKEAGIETRPLASILLSNLEANSSIPLEALPGHTRNEGRHQRGNLLLFLKIMLIASGVSDREEASRCPLFGLRRNELRALLPNHSLPNGSDWDSMGPYGCQWNQKGKTGTLMGSDGKNCQLSFKIRVQNPVFLPQNRLFAAFQTAHLREFMGWNGIDMAERYALKIQAIRRALR